MKKRAWLILPIILIVAVIWGTYHLTKHASRAPVPAPVAPATARNYAGNGFSVNYPAKFTVESIDIKSGMQEVNFTDRDPSDQKHEYDMLYTVYIKNDITDTAGLTTYVKNFINTYNGGSGAAVTEKNVSVAGTTGLQFSYNSTARGLSNDTVYTTAVIHNDTAYIIQLVNGNAADYMKFVSSFSF